MVFSSAPFLNGGMRFILDSSTPSIVKLINYSISGTSNASGLYDDQIEFNMIQTGSTTMSGLIFPIRGKMGSTEALLLQQGFLKTTDKVLYLGSTTLNPSGLLITVDSITYSIIPDGIHTYTVNGSTIYNKLMIRQSITGSLF